MFSGGDAIDVAYQPTAFDSYLTSVGLDTAGFGALPNSEQMAHRAQWTTENSNGATQHHQGYQRQVAQETMDNAQSAQWAGFAGQLAGGIGGMITDSFKMYYADKAQGAAVSAKIQITGMQEATKRTAISAQKTVELRKTAVAQRIAEMQKDVEGVRAKAAVRIEEVRNSAAVAVESVKQEGMTIRWAQKAAHDAWLRSSYHQPSPFAA